MSSILVEIRASSADFLAKMAVARAEMAKFSGEGSVGFARIGKGAALGLASVGAAAVATAAVSVDLGMKFQQSMELLRTQAGASQGEVNKLSSSVLGLSGQVATSPMVLSQALFHIVSTGARGAKAMEELRVAAEGAKVGNADLTDVTNALNATVVSGISGFNSTSQAMGALNAIVGAGDMHMQDLADALGGGVLQQLKGFGLSLSSIGGALATFGDDNIRGADASTALRMGVQALAEPSIRGAAALHELGLNGQQLGETMSKRGLNAAIGELNDHLKAAGYNADSSGQILTEAFGKKAGPALAILTGQFARFQQKTADVAKGANDFGSEWTATTHTLSFQLSALKDNSEALATRLGVLLIPTVTKLVGGLNSAVNAAEHSQRLRQIWDDISAAAQQAWTRYLKPAFDGLAAGYQSLMQWGEAHRQEFLTAWQDIKAALHTVWTGVIQPIFADIVNEFHVLSAAAIEHKAQFQKAWLQIRNELQQAWDQVLHPTFTALVSIVRLLGTSIAATTQIVVAHWPQISAAISASWTIIRPLLGAFFGILHGLLSAVSGLVNFINSHFGTIKAVISGVMSAVLGPIQVVANAVQGIAEAISAVTKAAGAIPSVTNKIPGGSGTTHFLKKVFIGASGGIVTRPTLGLIGEAGPEAVIPMGALNRAPGASPLSALQGGASVTHTHIYLDGKQVADVVTKHQRQNAQRGIPVAAG